MKCLSIRQPWAHLIVKGIKKIENRTWQTSHRGTIAIHTSKTEDSAGRAAAMDILRRHHPDVRLPAPFSMTYGCIIGVVDLVGITTETDDPWWAGDQFGWVLENPRELMRPVPFKGALSLFEVPDSIMDALK